MPRYNLTAQPRVLVIGCGSIGTRHLNNLLALGVRTLIAYDPREDRRRAVAKKSSVTTVETLAQAWACHPDAVIIAVPTSLHMPIAIEAAEHGCHLMIEKPLSHQLDADTDRLLKIARERQLISLVGCNLRFHPTLKQVKALCESQAIGRIVSARVEVGQYLPDWHPSEDYRNEYSAKRALGGGVILDDIHEIDYIRWLLGEIVAVTAFAGTLSRLEIDTEDVAAILLRFASGAIGEVHLDYVQRVSSRTCHLIGEEGTIRWDFSGGQTRWYAAATRQWQTMTNPAGWEPNQMYLDEMRHFVGCLRGAEEPALDVEQAARVLEVALAAKTSSVLGKTVELHPAKEMSHAY